MKIKPVGKLAKCNLCKQNKVRLSNGLKVSKYCVNCRKLKDVEKKEKKKLTKKYQKSLYKRLHAKAWTLVSLYVRTKGISGDWNTCYTCGELKPWKEMHCSHFHHGKSDFDHERNLRACCVKCNNYKSGNLAIYATKLARELGIEGMEKLRLDSNTHSYTIEDLENIIIELNKLLKND